MTWFTPPLGLRLCMEASTALPFISTCTSPRTQLVTNVPFGLFWIGTGLMVGLYAVTLA